jgi:hypothetical protein
MMSDYNMYLSVLLAESYQSPFMQMEMNLLHTSFQYTRTGLPVRLLSAGMF